MVGRTQARCEPIRRKTSLAYTQTRWAKTNGEYGELSGKCFPFLWPIGFRRTSSTFNKHMYINSASVPRKCVVVNQFKNLHYALCICIDAITNNNLANNLIKYEHFNQQQDIVWETIFYVKQLIYDVFFL